MRSLRSDLKRVAGLACLLCALAAVLGNLGLALWRRLRRRPSPPPAAPDPEPPAIEPLSEAEMQELAAIAAGDEPPSPDLAGPPPP